MAVAGLALGLALLTKFTCLVLVPAGVGVWLGVFLSRPSAKRGGMAPGIAQLMGVLATGLFLVNAGYGFEHAFRPLGQIEFHSKAWRGAPASGATRPMPEHPANAQRILEADPNPISSAAGPPQNRFAASVLGSLRVPVPAAYLQGIDWQRTDFETEQPCFLAGRWYEKGRWYYYLYALAVKAPLGHWALFLLALAIRLRRPGRPLDSTAECLLILTGLAVVVLVSSHTAMNVHSRYILPGLGVLCVWIAHALGSALRSSAVVRALCLAAWLLSASSVVWHYPHSLAYFNELAGGPANGWRHLRGSNIDWGQDLFLLRAWLRSHPDVLPVMMECAGGPASQGGSGGIDPWLAGIDYIPASPTCAGARHDPAQTSVSKPPWYIVSVNQLTPDGEPPRPLAGAECVAHIGYTMRVYRARTPR